MGVLTSIHGPDGVGCHEDALSHLGVLAGLLVILRLIFIEHLLLVAVFVSEFALDNFLILLFILCIISIPRSFIHFFPIHSFSTFMSTYLLCSMSAQGYYLIPGVNKI